MVEKEIIARCNTCRSPIYKGDIIWTSQTGQSSGQTVGSYGGASQNVGGGTTIHGGTYGAQHAGEHSSENWTQCGWCYDQWLAEIATHEKWKKTPDITKWSWVWITTIFLTAGGTVGLYLFNKNSFEKGTATRQLKPLHLAIIGFIIFVISFFITFSMFTRPAYPEPPKPDRYRFRIRK